MKFGKLLELRALPEWRDQYISYKKLKRITKMVQSDDDDESPPQMERRSGAQGAISSGSLEDSLLSSEEAAKAKCEAAFFALLEEDLRRINAHSAGQCALIAKRMAVLGQQHAAVKTMATPSASSYLTKESRVDAALLSQTYCDCARLRSFVQINSEGVRKVRPPVPPSAHACARAHTWLAALTTSTTPHASAL